MLWLKNELAQLILWGDKWNNKNPCVICKSLCKRDKMCGFFEEFDSNYSPTLMNTIKWIHYRVKHEWGRIDGKMFKAGVIIYIIVGVAFITSCF